MAVSAVLAFWGISLLLIVVPGPDWAFTLSTSLRGQSAFSAVGGLMVGYLVMTFVVAVGVGGLLVRSPSALTALTVAGGLYLMWLGVQRLIGITKLNAQPEPDDRPKWATFIRGVGVSGLNPKGLLVFVALLPQFTNLSGRWPVGIQLAALGLVFVVTCGAFYLALGTIAHSAFVRRPRLGTVVARSSGVGMVVVGGVLLLERLLS